MNTVTKRVAYIFQEATGWYVCDASKSMLDARGMAHKSKRAAIAWLREMGVQTTYTHYRTAKTRTRKIG